MTLSDILVLIACWFVASVAVGLWFGVWIRDHL